MDQSEAISRFVDVFAEREHGCVVVGPGADDAGVIRVGEKLLAVSTDYTNFASIGEELDAVNLYDRGYFLLVHNVSDLLATGAEPLAAVIAIGLPVNTSRDDIDAVAKGVDAAAHELGVAIVGGDTKEAPQLALCATVFGTVPHQPWARDGAAPGDGLYLSGSIGGVSAATAVLALGKAPEVLVQRARDALARPSLPIDLARRLRRDAFRIAATDVSDGLGADLTALLLASNVGCEVSGDLIPLHGLVADAARLTGASTERFAFGFGGDGQFVFAASPSDHLAIEGHGGVRIGTCTDSKDRWLLLERGRVVLPDFGHQDFRGLRPRDRLLQELSKPLW